MSTIAALSGGIKDFPEGLVTTYCTQSQTCRSASGYGGHVQVVLALTVSPRDGEISWTYPTDTQV